MQQALHERPGKLILFQVYLYFNSVVDVANVPIGMDCTKKYPKVQRLEVDQAPGKIHHNYRNLDSIEKNVGVFLFCRNNVSV